MFAFDGSRSRGLQTGRESWTSITRIKSACWLNFHSSPNDFALKGSTAAIPRKLLLGLIWTVWMFTIQPNVLCQFYNYLLILESLHISPLDKLLLHKVLRHISAKQTVGEFCDVVTGMITSNTVALVYHNYPSFFLFSRYKAIKSPK